MTANMSFSTGSVRRRSRYAEPVASIRVTFFLPHRPHKPVIASL